jgi:hypothetical protein
MLEYCHWWKDSWPLEKFVVYFCFQSSSVVDFKVKVKGRSRFLSVSSNIYFKLIWIDEMQIIPESRIVSYTWENQIKPTWLFELLYNLAALNVKQN